MPALGLKDYENVAGSAVIKEIRELGEKLEGYSVLHINSTVWPRYCTHWRR